MTPPIWMSLTRRVLLFGWSEEQSERAIARRERNEPFALDNID